MMKLLETVHHQHKLSGWLRLTAYIFSIGGFLFCLALFFTYTGFDSGLMVNDGIEEMLKSGGFSADGPRIYQHFANMYLLIMFYFLLFVGLTVLESRPAEKSRRIIFVQIASCIAIGLALIELWRVFREKGIRSQDVFWTTPHDQLLRNTIPFDWICVIFAFVLVAIQLLKLLAYFFERNKSVPQNKEVLS